MNMQGIAGVALVLFAASQLDHTYAADSEVAVSTACPTTDPASGIYGNDDLGVVIPAVKGKLIFAPGGPGFVEPDGALGTKLGWELRKKGTLVVTGRRVDGVAPPARAYIPRAYDDYVGGMSLYLVFPTPGCWEITGVVANVSLTFTVLVEKVGEGPSQRRNGPPAGWRLTTRWSGRVIDKVPSSNIGVRAAQLNR